METSWWNDNETTTAYIDFTKPEARKWYINRLKNLKETAGIDSFKFDAGESSWAPQVREKNHIQILMDGMKETLDIKVKSYGLLEEGQLIIWKGSHSLNTIEITRMAISFLQTPVLQGDIRDQPGVITADYVRAVSQFGPMVEVRSGYR